MDSRKSGIDTHAEAFPEGSSGQISHGHNRDNTLNVLVLGETDVGKSTWVNGIANYVEYESLDAALSSNDPKWKIPSCFTISDDDLNEQTIFIGPPDGNENEQTKVGESGTMFPQAHEFMWEDKKVRFIDTPGIGDSRGLPQDKINLANIFRYIETHQIKHLSAVIILMKPNQKVFTPALMYCIGELFTHLPRSYATNMMFGFTRTRPSCYRIGETLAPLRQFLAKIEEHQKVSLKLTKDTAFCFDNEAFRFLFASLPENGITFTAEERKTYASSWNQSVKETQRFLDRVSSLTPHDTTDIIALSDARQYISMLSKPVALISDMIERNIKSSDAEMQRIRCLDTDSVNFKRELTKQHKKVYYVSENLPHPRTVCTSPDHIEMVIDEHGTSQVHYTQHCHEECADLGSDTPIAVGDPKLLNCAAMASKGFIGSAWYYVAWLGFSMGFGDGPNCQECGCNWSVHMHVTYKQTMCTEMVETVNEDMKRLLDENGDTRKALETVIEHLQATLEEYKAEKEEIVRIAAMFGAFLNKSAIMPFNDAVEKYIKLSIQQAEILAKMTQNPTDIEHVETLCKWLKRYKQQKLFIKTGVKDGCNAPEVKEYWKQLLNLKHSGHCIKEMFECEKRGMEDQEKHMRSGAQSHSAGNQPSASHSSKAVVSHAAGNRKSHVSSVPKKLNFVSSVKAHFSGQKK